MPGSNTHIDQIARYVGELVQIGCISGDVREITINLHDRHGPNTFNVIKYLEHILKKQFDRQKDYIEPDVKVLPNLDSPPEEPVDPVTSHDPDSVVPEKFAVFDTNDDPNHWVVLGEPGCGKTSLLLKFLTDGAQTYLEDSLCPLPVYLPLANWPSRCNELENYITRQLTEDWGIRDFGMNNLLILLDGLNEIEQQQGNNWRTVSICSFIALHPHAPIIMTCREHDYEAYFASDFSSVKRARIEHFDAPRIRRYLETHIEAPEKVETLWTLLRGDHDQEAQPNPRLLGVASNPFYLDKIVRLFVSNAPLPPSRSLILGEAIKMHWLRESNDLDHSSAHEDQDSQVDFDTFSRILGRLAYMIIERSRSTSVGLDWATPRLRRKFPADAIEAVLKLGEDLGLIEQETRDNSIGFSHQLVQEYLAAYSLRRSNFEAICRLTGREWTWHEVLLMLAEMDMGEHRATVVNAFADALSNSRENNSIWLCMATLKALERLEATEAIEEILNILHFEDANVRLLAAHTLVNLGWQPDGRIAYWIALQAWDECTAKGDEAVPQLKHLLYYKNESRWYIRSAVVKTLQRIGGAEALRQIVSTLDNDSDRRVRAAAARALHDSGLYGQKLLYSANTGWGMIAQLLWESHR